MSAIARQEEHELERRVFAQRTDGGLQALREFLLLRQAALNRAWPNAKGDLLAELQGEAKATNKLIDLIERGPKIGEASK